MVGDNNAEYIGNTRNAAPSEKRPAELLKIIERDSLAAVEGAPRSTVASDPPTGENWEVPNNEDKIRVTFILPGFPRRPVGGYKVIYSYANMLARSGHSVTVAHASENRFRYADSALPKLGVAASMRHARDLVTRSTSVKWFEMDPAVNVLHSPRMSAGSLPDGDVVVASSCWTAPFVSGLPQRKGKKFYFLQHYESWAANESFVDKTWRLPITKIVISKWLQDRAHELGVSASYVPNAIDAMEFPQGPRIADRKFGVCGLVSDLPWKRTDLFIDTLQIAKKKYPQLEAIAFGTCDRPAELPKWVHFIQSPTHATLTKDIYQSSRVYLCTSDAEGWHLPPAEAMASGCAVVSTDIRGVAEYADGFAQFAPIGDPFGLSSRVLALLLDEELCSKVATASHEHITSYSPEDATNRLYEVFTQ